MSVTGSYTAFDPKSDAQISRETLENLDSAPTSREQWKIMFISGMGFFTDAYDLFVIGIVATLVTTQWHIAGYQKSLLTSLALLTSAAGRHHLWQGRRPTWYERKSTAMRCSSWQQEPLLRPSPRASGG